MKIFLLTVMFLSGSAILIGLAGELRARARRRAPAAADYGAYCRILEAVYADWRGERRYRGGSAGARGGPGALGRGSGRGSRTRFPHAVCLGALPLRGGAHGVI